MKNNKIDQSIHPQTLLVSKVEFFSLIYWSSIILTNIIFTLIIIDTVLIA